MQGPNKWFTHCHCSMCRKHHGTLYGTSIGIEHKNFRWIQGEDAVVHYRSSAAFERPFCKHCGSVVPDTSGETVVVPAGTVAGDPDMRPRAHIFVASKSPMEKITDDLKQFDAYPEGYGTVLPTPARELTEKIQGSCLCGDVAFALDAAPTRMVKCHCSRCRRNRGAAHGANVFVHQNALRWLKGDNQVQMFKPADVARYTTAFCKRCGSRMPASFAALNIYLVPVGALDTPIPIEGSVHIFVGSKAPWFTITDNDPQFDELPPRERFAELFGI
ncbi:MAG TPA: GFA family protein [Steroidobacteraceae bacterium]|nr:GFA family protein [Steroidobacteraceae bacterium]